MLRLLPGPPARRLSISARTCKNHKSNFKKLGISLQKGTVGDTNLEPPARSTTDLSLDLEPAKLALEATVNKHLEEIEDSFDTVAYMSKNDIAIQQNFDQGNQLGSYPSQHFLDRKRLLRKLPDEIDAFTTPWEDIEDIYGLLRRLDEDKAVHLKYARKFGIDATDFVTKVRMGSNMDDMCRAGRRNERYDVPRAFERVFRRLHPYNIVGFDRSIVGVPTRSPKHFGSTASLTAVPREFIQDMRPFSLKIRIHKADVDFMDDELLQETILPHDPKPLPPETVLRDFGRPIMLDCVDDYISSGYPVEEVVLRVEKETYAVRDQLAVEILRQMMPGSAGVLNIHLLRFRSNEYVLASRELGTTTNTGPTVQYRCQSFDVIPVYGALLASMRDQCLLFRHLYRVIMTNLDYHIDMLLRVKYRLPEDIRMFMQRLRAKVRRVVSERIMPLMYKHLLCLAPLHAAAVHRLGVGPLHAVTHKHMEGPFLRLYWIRRPRLRLHKGPLRLNMVLFQLLVAADREVKREVREWEERERVRKWSEKVKMEQERERMTKERRERREAKKQKKALDEETKKTKEKETKELKVKEIQETKDATETEDVRGEQAKTNGMEVKTPELEMEILVKGKQEKEK